MVGLVYYFVQTTITEENTHMISGGEKIDYDP